MKQIESKMESKIGILQKIAQLQGAIRPLPELEGLGADFADPTVAFAETLVAIGGECFQAKNWEDLHGTFRVWWGDRIGRIVTTLPQLTRVGELVTTAGDFQPHQLKNVELAILEARFAVAENGAVWLTEEQMGQRVLPYICQHLAIIVAAGSILSTMHNAYALNNDEPYGFAGFIAGPSKTADIEQSLVLGAHGPRTMTVFILEDEKL